MQPSCEVWRAVNRVIVLGARHASGSWNPSVITSTGRPLAERGRHCSGLCSEAMHQNRNELIALSLCDLRRIEAIMGMQMWCHRRDLIGRPNVSRSCSSGNTLLRTFCYPDVAEEERGQSQGSCYLRAAVVLALISAA